MDLGGIHPSFLLKVIYGVDISVVIKLPYFLGVDQAMPMKLDVNVAGNFLGGDSGIWDPKKKSMRVGLVS